MIKVIEFKEFPRHQVDGSTVPWPHVALRFEGINGDGQTLNVEVEHLPEGAKVGDSLILAFSK